jgi:tRNA 2-thiouridine synthesizing protein E
MSTVKFNGKTYDVDTEGFLVDHRQWDEDFAAGAAPLVQISGGLSRRHWDVIYYIRQSLQEHGRCPLVYDTCQTNGLRLKDLEKLFPTGYLRGACRLAGCTYREGYVKYSWVQASDKSAEPLPPEKVYGVDVRGFLVDPDEWDEYFAISKAHEMKMAQELEKEHWRIIYFLRDSYAKNKAIPTIYETCDANDLELEDLERLFPDGYHRGAVKIAGLRVR